VNVKTTFLADGLGVPPVPHGPSPLYVQEMCSSHEEPGDVFSLLGMCKVGFVGFELVAELIEDLQPGDEGGQELEDVLYAQDGEMQDHGALLVVRRFLPPEEGVGHFWCQKADIALSRVETAL